MKEYKVVVVGTAGVGKSSLTIRFTSNSFSEKYDPTVEDSYNKVLTLDGEDYTLEILDTAGTEAMSALRELYMTKGQGFVLVYSVSEPSSMKALLSIRDSINRAKDGTNCPMVVVGNKCDLPERGVSLQEGEDFTAKNMPGAVHVEASAKNGKNGDLVFHSLIRKIEKGPDGGDSTVEGKKKAAPAPSGKAEKEKSGGCLLI